MNVSETEIGTITNGPKDYLDKKIILTKTKLTELEADNHKKKTQLECKLKRYNINDRNSGLKFSKKTKRKQLFDCDCCGNPNRFKHKLFLHMKYNHNMNSFL